jgi:hypothetical protein
MQKAKARAEKHQEKVAPTLLQMLARMSGPPGAGNPALIEFQKARYDADQLNDLLREKGCATHPIGVALLGFRSDKITRSRRLIEGGHRQQNPPAVGVESNIHLAHHRRAIELDRHASLCSGRQGHSRLPVPGKACAETDCGLDGQMI